VAYFYWFFFFFFFFLEIQGVHPHISGMPSISQSSMGVSPVWTPIIAAEVRKLHLCPVKIMNEICVFYVATIQIICLFSDALYSDSTLVLMPPVK
jgi:hypothetical protein